MLPPNLNLEELTQAELVELSKSVNDQLTKLRKWTPPTPTTLERYGVLQSHRKHWQFTERDGKLVTNIPIRVFSKRHKRSTWKEYRLVYDVDKSWELIPWKDTWEK